MGTEFRGTFRPYQQRILDEAEAHLEDGKLHIVAPPGSGKTILGLELIRRLGAPALILSPTVTIRRQWCRRYAEHFLPPEGGGGISEDIREPAELTSITYQAVYAAYRQLTLEEEDPEGGAAYSVPFSGFALRDALVSRGITTICLDEAHHLKQEWQSALTALLDELEGITVIALTATPPYDSPQAAWDRYIALCGEIDEEITVPELVADGSLCPHQDYVYFNYPGHEERALLYSWRDRVTACLGEIFGGPLLSSILDAAGLTDGEPDREGLAEHWDEYLELARLAEEMGYRIPGRAKRLIGLNRRRAPDIDLGGLERILSLITGGAPFAGLSGQIRERLRQYGLMGGSQIQLSPDGKTQRALTASRGKLDSIARIVQHEYTQLGDGLRLVVLTDYIRKDHLPLLGSRETIDAMGAVPIFEVLRRTADESMEFVLLSGGLVLSSRPVAKRLLALSAERLLSCRANDVGDTGFCELTFSSSNQRKVELLTEAFSLGYFQVLIGTAALLGEGWDSPCMNSLILATTVGSFVLSNQMRGRAIRADDGSPGKTANIWHLVTVEPRLRGREEEGGPLSKLLYSPDRLVSGDYETLERRFTGFMGPVYGGEAIESGVGRLTDIRPPYDEPGVEAINSRMLERSGARSDMAESWRRGLGDVREAEVLEMNTVHGNVRPIGFFWTNLLLVTVTAAILFGICSAVANGLSRWFFDSLPGYGGAVLALALTVTVTQGLYQGYLGLMQFLSPKAAVRRCAGCILETLREMGAVTSRGAELYTRASRYGEGVYCGLRHATAREKHLFAQAVGEFFSPIENPKYVLVRRYRILFWRPRLYPVSFACPSRIGRNKASAQLFARKLGRAIGSMQLGYTRTAAGAELLVRCKRASYVGVNALFVEIKRVLHHGR